MDIRFGIAAKFNPIVNSFKQKQKNKNFVYIIVYNFFNIDDMTIQIWNQHKISRFM